MNLEPHAVTDFPHSSRTARVFRRFEWFLVAALAAPIGILLHELGHFFAARAFGLSDVILHFGSVSGGGADAGATPVQQAVQAGAGPVVTLGLIGFFCALTALVGSSAWTVAPAFAVGIRSAIIGIAYFVARLRGLGGDGNFDELNAARALDISVDLVVAVNVILIAAAWGYLVSSIPRGRRLRSVALALAGTGVSIALYVGWLGPIVLP